MTIEEIQATLQTVADNQAQLAQTQTGQASRIERLETAFQSVAQSLQMLIEMTATHEERHDAHDEAQAHTNGRLDALINAQVRADERMDALINSQAQANERLDALINSQVGYEARQERLEESYRQVAASHQMLIQLVRIQEERIDGNDAAIAHTDEKLNALIDSDIKLRERFDVMVTKWDQMATVQVDHSAAIRALIERGGN